MRFYVQNSFISLILDMESHEKSCIPKSVLSSKEENVNFLTYPADVITKYNEQVFSNEINLNMLPQDNILLYNLLYKLHTN